MAEIKKESENSCAVLNAVTHSENTARTQRVVISRLLHVDSSSDDVLKSVPVLTVQ
jgi:hypothetical protein